ncbi:NUDIX hydrolase [Desulfotomaculum sp. 1211_IL3151]|uniref:NUDIX hydrolase n=1 Tax=Desulfotomaculum sp. 1211_IL3151 TaxID=3084055 RepID=UPI002FD88F7B
MKLEVLIQQKLDREPAILDREEYFNSVVLMLLIKIEGEYHFIFQKRASTIRQGGEVSFPGGKYEESDKTYEYTALRETSEEMGIAENKITILGSLGTLVGPMGVIIDTFVGITDISIDHIQANPDEVEKIFTVPVEYFIKNQPERYYATVQFHPSHTDEKTKQEIVSFPADILGLPEGYKKPWGKRKYSILVYKTQEEMIWGLTAKLIDNFVKKIMQ